MNYHLIDAPITPYSTRAEIEAWISTLKRMEQTAEVQEAIADAQRLLKDVADDQATN